jgi:hypothetical protein
MSWNIVINTFRSGSYGNVLAGMVIHLRTPEDCVGFKPPTPEILMAATPIFAREQYLNLGIWGRNEPHALFMRFILATALLASIRATPIPSPSQLCDGIGSRSRGIIPRGVRMASPSFLDAKQTIIYCHISCCLVSEGDHLSLKSHIVSSNRRIIYKIRVTYT